LFIIFRCQLRDKEAESREKDTQISELKAKIVRLTSAVRQLEAQTGELQVENLQLSEVETPIFPLHCECMVLFSCSLNFIC
jgi:hypothetical protein